ncbi:MAG: hypothetical protein C4567_12165 [Deltaproteobacteria bacterium]|nr:MAG: hypothetical protein C4567_12165 [Deltaproteobacteria bacterium]
MRFCHRKINTIYFILIGISSRPPEGGKKYLEGPDNKITKASATYRSNFRGRGYFFGHKEKKM